MSKKIEKIKPFLDPLYNIIISSLCSGILIYIVKQFPKLKFIHQPIIYIIIITLCIWIALYTTRKIQILEFLFKPLLYSVLTSLSILVIVALLLFFWYNYCFFPDDQNYLQNIVSSIEYTDDSLEETELDLIRTLNNNAKIVNPLDKSDRAFLLKGDLRMRDYYVDINPYNNKADSNNLKYSTGRIFYYIYQKNSIVLKGNSNITFSLKKSKGRRRFIEFDMVFPKFIRSSNGRGILNIYFTEKKRRLILKREIEREEKPDIKPFRYSNPISSIIFYLKHPGRSVLTDYVGWEKIKHELPCCAGMLEIEFIVKNGKRDYLFLGTPRVYAVKEKRRNDHINIVYLIFDTLSKYHIDLYEYYDIFSGKSFDDALKVLGERRITTPVIDRYVGNICLFDNIYSAGQVTRPSIVPLWTSQEYTRSRLPVFRNIVTDNNKQEFYNMKFATLADELSKYGYLTKQISCNAQGHGVSGVGVDLGFDENYDYTMEASELTENFRRIINFLEQNQNKKFFLYSHINVPHVPRWIPIRYFLSAYWDCNFISSTATILGNIRYMNDCLEKIMTTLKKLRLDKNTIVIISSDHSMGPRLNFRGEEEERDWMSILKRESQLVSSDYSHSIYVRKGWSSLYNNIVNIPWIFIAPLNLDVIPGRINSSISALDISPTLYDIATGKKNDSFKGKSFKRLLYGKDRNKSNSSFIPLVGRFQRGFVYKGRYKYWINILGLYKYRMTRDKKRYIMQQEYLYDLYKDPYEINNLAHDCYENELLREMRELYSEQYTDYPDKNFIQIAPPSNGKKYIFTIKVEAKKGRIIYPEVYDKDVSYKYRGYQKLVFKVKVNKKSAYLSFETDPPNSPIIITIYKNDKLIPRDRIFSSVESVNLFNNPIRLLNKIDFHIAREQGKTGLEKKHIPAGSVHFSRIPLNYWLEMSRRDKDINLSPGIKEVLRGWGYIQ